MAHDSVIEACLSMAGFHSLDVKEMSWAAWSYLKMCDHSFIKLRILFV